MRLISRYNLLPRKRRLFPSRGKIFYSSLQRRTGCEIHRTSLSRPWMYGDGLFAVCNRPLASIKCCHQEFVKLYFHAPYILMAWCLIKQRKCFIYLLVLTTNKTQKGRVEVHLSPCEICPLQHCNAPYS